MAVPKTKSNDALLKNLVPLNTLSEEQLGLLLSRIVIEKARKGQYLFREGDSDHQNIYLLSGTVALLSGQKEMDLVSSGTQTARFALAHQLPRKHSAMAKSAVTYVRIDSRMLSDMLARSQTASYEVNEANSAGKSDWMSLLLHSPVFQQIPPANLQRVMMRMRQLPVSADDTIIRQGDEGDYFYLISRGVCRVTRQPEADRPPVELAQLKVGQGFGEEALISDKPRSSTVTMLTDGELVRLSKQDFVELVKRPLAHNIDYTDACGKVQEDALWVDVRTPEEYDAGHLPDAINMPFFSLRFQASSLASDRVYLIYGNEVGQSTTAAYLLVERGYEVFVLREGWSEIAVLAKLELPVGESQVDNVIDFNRDADLSREIEEQQPGLESDSDTNAVQELQNQLTEAKSKFDQKIAQYQTEQKLLKQALSVAKRKLEVQKESAKAREVLSKEVAQLNTALEAGDAAELKNKEAYTESERLLQKQVADLEEALAQLKSDLKKADSDAQKAQQAKSRLEIQLQQEQEKHNQGQNDLQGELEILRQQHEEAVSAQQAQLQRTLAEQKSSESQFHEALSEANKRADELKKELQSAQDARETTEKKYLEELSMLQTRLEEAAKQHAELDQQKGGLERELESIRLAGDDADAQHLNQLNALRSELDEARTSITELNKVSQQMQAEQGSAESIIASLKQELEKTRIEYAELQHKTVETETEHHKNLNAIQEQLKASQIEAVAKSDDFNEIRAELKNSEEQRLMLSAKLEQAQQKKEFLKRSLATAEDAIEISDAILKERDEEYEALKSEQSALLVQVEELKEELEREAARQIDLEALQAEKSELEKQLVESQNRQQSEKQLFDADTSEQQQIIKKMELELSAARSEVEQLSRIREEAQGTQQSLQDANQEISRLNNTVQGLREVQLEMEQQLSDDAGEEIAILKAKLEQQEKRRHNAEEQAKKVDVLRRERDVQETAVEMLVEDLECLESEKRQLEEDKEDLERQLLEIRDQMGDSNAPDNLLEQLDELRIKAESYERERDQARSETAGMQQEVQELRSVIETYVEQIQDTQSCGVDPEMTALRSELDMVRSQASEDLEKMRRELSNANTKVNKQGVRDMHEAASLQALRQEIDSSRQALREREQMLRLSQTQCRTLEDSIEDRDREVDQLKRKLELLIRKTGGLGEFSEALDSERLTSQFLPPEETHQISDLLQEIRAVGQSAIDNDKKGSKLGRLFRKK